MTANVFGLSYAALSCSNETTLEEFSNAILCRDIGTSEHESLPAPVASSAGGADRVSQLLPGLDMDTSLVSTFLCFSKRVLGKRLKCPAITICDLSPIDIGHSSIHPLVPNLPRSKTPHALFFSTSDSE